MDARSMRALIHAFAAIAALPMAGMAARCSARSFATADERRINAAAGACQTLAASLQKKESEMPIPIRSNRSVAGTAVSAASAACSALAHVPARGLAPVASADADVQNSLEFPRMQSGEAGV